MKKIQILHNPLCSKSRATLELLQSKGIEPEVIEYLKAPLNESQIESLSMKLALKPSEFIRKAEFTKLGLTPELTEHGLIGQMAAHPILIERPVVINGDKARIGRPPEAILEIV